MKFEQHGKFTLYNEYTVWLCKNSPDSSVIMLGEVGLRWEEWGWEFGGSWIKDSFNGS